MIIQIRGRNLLMNEREITDYLKKINFQKHLCKLEKKLYKTEILIYGCGIFFDVINKEYDLSKLNVIGVSDAKFLMKDSGKLYQGYKIIPIPEVQDANPKYVLVATINSVNIIEDFINTRFENSKIKFMQLINKPFLDMLKEIWN